MGRTRRPTPADPTAATPTDLASYVAELPEARRTALFESLLLVASESRASAMELLRTLNAAQNAKTKREADEREAQRDTRPGFTIRLNVAKSTEHLTLARAFDAESKLAALAGDEATAADLSKRAAALRKNPSAEAERERKLRAKEAAEKRREEALSHAEKAQKKLKAPATKRQTETEELAWKETMSARAIQAGTHRG